MLYSVALHRTRVRAMKYHLPYVISNPVPDLSRDTQR